MKKGVLIGGGVILFLVFLILRSSSGSTPRLSTFSSKKVPPFEKTDQLCNYLPIADLDKFMGSSHLELKSNQPLKDVKSCDILYPNKKELIFEYDQKISLERGKKIANTLKSLYMGYITLPGVKNPHILVKNKKGNFVELTFKKGVKSSISLRTSKLNLSQQQWQKLAQILDKAI